MAAGEASAAGLLGGYLDRIEALDDQGPSIQAVLSLNPNALDEARALDEGNSERGPLHGVAVLVKDNIETRELPTTAGSMALATNSSDRDAPIIAKLRAAGAIILGKTNLSEWANFRSMNSTSGWSALGGQTRNPHSLDRSPCGSSSGSGAAVAAGFAPLAIGTETNGSILCPAAMNGIVGFKPTVGLLSRTHIVPISPTQDTAGPMTRSVRDAALMLSVMAGRDPSDPATLAAEHREADYVSALTENLEGVRIGVLTFAVGRHRGVTDRFTQAAAALRSLGAELVPLEPPEQSIAWDQALFVMQSEFKTTLNEYLGTTRPEVKVRNLDDLMKFNEEHHERELALFGQDLLAASNATAGMADERYPTTQAALRKAARDDGIHALLDEHDLDVLIAPSRQPAFLIDAVNGDSSPDLGVGADYLPAIAGTPNLTVPMGTVQGLPVGLSFMGRAWDDATVLRVGYAFEQITQAIAWPTFVRSAFESEHTAVALLPLSDAD